MALSLPCFTPFRNAFFDHTRRTSCTTLASRTPIALCVQLKGFPRSPSRRHARLNVRTDVRTDVRTHVRAQIRKRIRTHTRTPFTKTYSCKCAHSHPVLPRPRKIRTQGVVHQTSLRTFRGGFFNLLRDKDPCDASGVDDCCCDV
jgi:hypothetical protein